MKTSSILLISESKFLRTASVTELKRVFWVKKKKKRLIFSICCCFYTDLKEKKKRRKKCRMCWKKTPSLSELRIALFHRPVRHIIITIMGSVANQSTNVLYLHHKFKRVLEKKWMYNCVRNALSFFTHLTTMRRDLGFVRLGKWRWQKEGLWRPVMNCTACWNWNLKMPNV